MSSSLVDSAIGAAARASGVSERYLRTTAARESAFDPTAKAATSSATGLYQFIERTWLDMLDRYGDAYGLGEAADLADSGQTGRRAALALRLDAEASALMAAALARENADALQARLGRAPSDGELYAAHVLGAAGAGALIETVAAAPETKAETLFPAAAAANRGLFYEASGEPRSASALLAALTRSFNAEASATPPTVDAAPTMPLTQAPGVAERVARAAAPGPATNFVTRLSPLVVEALARLDPPQRAEPGRS